MVGVASMINEKKKRKFGSDYVPITRQKRKKKRKKQLIENNHDGSNDPHVAIDGEIAS
jgi:hypothetical protein